VTEPTIEQMGLSTDPDTPQLIFPVGWGLVGYGIATQHDGKKPVAVGFALADQPMDRNKTFEFSAATYPPALVAFRSADDVQPIIDIFQRLQTEMRQWERDHANRLPADIGIPGIDPTPSIGVDGSGPVHE
jgi:hypothetical protein